MFEERELYLSDIGKDYLEKLKGAQNNNEKYLEQLKKDFPSVRNPHLEYFSPLLMADQIDPMLIFEWLEVLQISKGCSHLCNHCYYGAGMPVDVMPFYKIIQLLEAAKNTTENRLLGRSRPHYLNGIVLHHDNEIFDYYDPLYDADAGDVMNIILKYYPEQIINITTRGWYTGDFIGLRAGKKIAKLMEIFSIYIRFSIDLYDTRGNIDRYIYRMVEVFNVFSEVIDIEQKLVFANVACDMRNIRKTEEIARIILYLNLIEKPFDQIEYNIISLSDRAEKQGVQSIEKYSIDSDLLGFHIAPSGKLISHVDGNDFMFNEALWPEEERMDITPILPKKNRSKNRENQVSNFNDSNDLSAISPRLANVIFSNAKINDILEESNSFNKLTEMPETVVDESIAILLSIDHEEVSEYLLEMKNTGRIKIIPNDKMFKDISNLIVKNKNNKCWLLIWEDIATKFSTLTVDIIIYMALKAYNEENIKLEESFVLAEKLVDNDGGRRTDDSSITERKKIVDIIAQEIAIAASCYHNSTIKITKLSIVDGYNTALVGKRQIEDGIVAAEIRLGINTLFLPDGQLAALIGHELGHIETGSFSFSFKENPILFIIGICSFLMIWVVPKPIDLICFIVACASFLLESVYSCYDLMGKEEAWQADTDRLGAIYASIAGYSPEEMLNYLSLKEKWDLFNLGRKLYQGRPFRRRKIKEVIDTLKQSGEIEYYRAIYLEKINEIQQGQPLDVQTKWSNEKRKGLDGGKGVVETSGKRGWLVVDKMVLTGWWDFTKVLNKIKLYRDIDLTKYGIEGVLNLSKSLESKTIEIIEDEEEVTENIDFDFSIEGNGNVLIEADTYRQLYLMYPDMVVYGILRQVL
ncbi:MAG: hypothetical protein KAI91_02940, partial [Candidatus Omnitrophica bacterium]|nr:hypothetical protein [Candidatus Omnitrophota bacterium]